MNLCIYIMFMHLYVYIIKTLINQLEKAFMNSKNIFVVSVLFMATLLSGCGGGGGAPVTPTTIAIASPSMAASTVPIVTSVPPSTYAAGSEEKAVFDLFNGERAFCDFGFMAQNAALDKANAGHGDWLLSNNYNSHYQIASTPAFTGVSPEDRAALTGYGVAAAFSYGEVETDSGGSKTGKGVIAVRGLLNAPYHLLAMLRGNRDIGIAMRDKSDIGSTPNNRSVLNIGMGVRTLTAIQSPLPGSIRTYPCNGSTGITPKLDGEYPNPVPGRNLLASPLGSTIGVVVDTGHTIAITIASMINVATGANVVMRPAVTAANDPNATGGIYYLNSNEAYISADAPLAALTTYQATISGTDNGITFSRTFHFTTGN
jgi:uncharacterized protein YkwD